MKEIAGSTVFESWRGHMQEPVKSQMRAEIEEIRKKAEAIKIAANPHNPAQVEDRIVWVGTEVDRLLRSLDRLSQIAKLIPDTR